VVAASFNSKPAGRDDDAIWTEPVSDQLRHAFLLAKPLLPFPEIPAGVRALPARLPPCYGRRGQGGLQQYDLLDLGSTVRIEFGH
jgi:hypothetical protein